MLLDFLNAPFSTSQPVADFFGQKLEESENLEQQIHEAIAPLEERPKLWGTKNVEL